MDDPLPPPESDGIPEVGKRPPGGGRGRGGGIEFDPAVGGEPGFHPAVRVPLPDGPVAPDAVVVPGAVPVDEAGGDPLQAHHDGQGRGEILAVPRPRGEQERGQGVGAGQPFQLEGIRVLRTQVLLQGARPRVAARGGARHLPRPARDPGVQVRQLQVFPRDLLRNREPVRHRRGVRREGVGDDRIAQPGAAGPARDQVAGRVAPQGARFAADRQRPAQGESHGRVGRFQEVGLFDPTGPQRGGLQLVKTALDGDGPEFRVAAGPGPAVEAVECQPPPAQLPGPVRRVRFYPHHHGVRRLQRAVPAEFHPVRKAGDQPGRERRLPVQPGGDPRQQEEQGNGRPQDQERDPEEGGGRGAGGHRHLPAGTPRRRGGGGPAGGPAQAPDVAAAHFGKDQEGEGGDQEGEEPEEKGEVPRQGGGGQQLGAAEEGGNAVVPLAPAGEEARRRGERQQVEERLRPGAREPGVADRRAPDAERHEAGCDPGRSLPPAGARVHPPAEREDPRKERDGGGVERPGRSQRAETGTDQAVGGGLERAGKGHSSSNGITCAERRRDAGNASLGRGVRMIL